MKTVSTMFRAIEDMKELMEEPQFKIGFQYLALDIPTNVDLDLGKLMLHFGYTEEYALCNSFYKKYPNSLAMPMSKGVDHFFDHLKDIGIYSKTAPFGGLEQCETTREVYEALIPITA